MTTYIETKTNLKEAILHQLNRGRSNALPGRLLAQRLGFKDDRRIRLAIRSLIADGHPIAASVSPPMGFFIAETVKEATKYLSDLKGRLVEDAYRHRDFKIAARAVIQPEQLEMI